MVRVKPAYLALLVLLLLMMLVMLLVVLLRLGVVVPLGLWFVLEGTEAIWFSACPRMLASRGNPDVKTVCQLFGPFFQLCLMLLFGLISS